jgi:hypothetical protein
MKRFKYTNMSVDIQIYIYLFLSFGDAEAVLNLSSIWIHELRKQWMIWLRLAAILTLFMKLCILTSKFMSSIVACPLRYPNSEILSKLQLPGCPQKHTCGVIKLDLTGQHGNSSIRVEFYFELFWGWLGQTTQMRKPRVGSDR